MFRTRKLIALGALAVALGTAALGMAPALSAVAATPGPALAHRHTPAPPSGQQVSAQADSRHTTGAPLENRHSP